MTQPHNFGRRRSLRTLVGVSIAGALPVWSQSSKSNGSSRTPAVVQIRFDTHFFLATAPEGVEPVVDGSEIVDHIWYSPRAALDAYGREQLPLVFPTIKHLEQFSSFDSADALIAHAAQQTVEPVEPRILMEGEVARVLLPGEPGYD